VISPEDQVLQAYQTGVLTREEAVVTYQAVTTATPANQAIALADAGVLNDDEGATLYAAAAITTGDTIYWWSYRPPIGKFGKPVGVWIIWPGDGPPTVVQLPPFTSPTPLPDPTPWPGYYTWDGKKWNFIPFPIPIF
jgi:hypothetical protein